MSTQTQPQPWFGAPSTPRQRPGSRSGSVHEDIPPAEGEDSFEQPENIQNIQEALEIKYPDMPKLVDLRGSLDPTQADPTSEIQSIKANFPSKQLFYILDPLLRQRRYSCLRAGATMFEKEHLRKVKVVTKRLALQVFPRELQLLEKVLSRAEAQNRLDSDGMGFRLIDKEYQILQQVLFMLKLTAEDAFRMAGKTPPTLPSWGADDDSELFYCMNDFEILAVCFVAEVEHFLVQLSTYYDFVSRKPITQNADVLKAAQEIIRESTRARSMPRDVDVKNTKNYFGFDFGEHRPVKSEPVEPVRSTSKPAFIREGTTGLGNILGANSSSNNARLAEILQPMAPSFDAHPHGFTVSVDPAEAEQFRRMGSQPPDRGRETPPRMPSRQGSDSGRRSQRPLGPGYPARGSAPDPDDDPSDSDDDGWDGRRSSWFNPVSGNCSHQRASV
ncbi:hypothetical protein GGX14DRAFT_386827 [Mycena pura]|uniref:Uncharacterized protein n=1 Tax=Mycena pura TaxID=153505 RepID=A0AAD6YQH1_9AGAR|nr:hypothetical protein GGX14DRAFT_386827 [Mycena pura]